MYHSVIKPLLLSMDPEQAHTIASHAGRFSQSVPFVNCFLRKKYAVLNETLRTRVFGLDFENPVGLAAGFDKNAHLIDFFYSLGFGYTEVGSVTAKPTQGNPKPRLFRLPQDSAIINRMGLNNEGAQQIASNVEGSKRNFPVGINITKTPEEKIIGDKAVEDILWSFDVLAPSADYVTINISCPNTADGKTFEDPLGLELLLKEVRIRKNVPPVLVKFSPDMNLKNLEEAVRVSMHYRIDGYVISNATTHRSGLATKYSELESIGAGGLSGGPLQTRSTNMIRLVSFMTKGSVPIIGVGGVDSAESAYEKIKAGASLVQLYTGLVYQGPRIAKKINEGLVILLERDGLKSLKDAVGVSV